MVLEQGTRDEVVARARSAQQACNALRKLHRSHPGRQTAELSGAEEFEEFEFLSHNRANA